MIYRKSIYSQSPVIITNQQKALKLQRPMHQIAHGYKLCLGMKDNYESTLFTNKEAISNALFTNKEAISNATIISS